MRIIAAIILLISLAVPSFAAETQKPESIAEKMSFKMVRGVTNLITSPAELPKQIILTGQTYGPQGYLVGTIKGVIMTCYRAFMGATETVFFAVPQPGYYDPMIDPEFVWQGWSSPQSSTPISQTPPAQRPGA